MSAEAPLRDTDYRSRSHGETISGTFAAEVCGDSGCYDLDVDVVDDEVVTVYFPNGGHNDISGGIIDESGYAYGEAYTWSEGYNGEWEIYIYDWEDALHESEEEREEW